MLSRPLRNRPGRTRTCNPRFWRPVLCQLSYEPKLHNPTTTLHHNPQILPGPPHEQTSTAASRQRVPLRRPALLSSFTGLCLP
jgi:hypothetical protein